jgi:hypothetical protein
VSEESFLPEIAVYCSGRTNKGLRELQSQKARGTTIMELRFLFLFLGSRFIDYIL